MEMQKDTASNGAFRARSGRTVRVGGDGTVMFDHANGYLSPKSAMDAEEFFQAKRDEDLGRWRSPAEPDWVVREADRDTEGRRTVLVLNERNFSMHHLNDRVLEPGYEEERHCAARDYFQAHPERTRAWADAQFITWRDGAYLPQTAQRDTGHMKLGWRFGRDEGDAWFSEDQLAREIGDADVTILIGGAS